MIASWQSLHRRAASVTPAQYQYIAAVRTVYDALISEGEALHPETIQALGQRGSSRQSVAANLLRCFRRHADAVLPFVSEPTVPFTNNVG